jgi:transposase
MWGKNMNVAAFFLLYSGSLVVARNGDCFPKYGYWNTVYRRFALWSEQGVFEQLHQSLADDADMEHLLIDSTIIRAHPCAAGASKKVAARSVRR